MTVRKGAIIAGIVLGATAVIHFIIFMAFAWAAVIEPGTSEDETNGALLAFGLTVIFIVLTVIAGVIADDSEDSDGYL